LPGGNIKKEEIHKNISYKSKDMFYGDGVKINMEKWGLYIVYNTPLHKYDIIGPLSNVCNHFTACYSPIYVIQI